MHNLIASSVQFQGILTVSMIWSQIMLLAVLEKLEKVEENHGFG